jgi:hypothetical protein
MFSKLQGSWIQNKSSSQTLVPKLTPFAFSFDLWALSSFPIQMIEIDLESFYTDRAKLAERSHYEQKALFWAGEGQEVVLTGKAPEWLYLIVAHALHGKAKKLIYRSPVTKDVVIFDHSPF